MRGAEEAEERSPRQDPSGWHPPARPGIGGELVKRRTCAQELAPAANRPGLRHVAFKVDDVRGVVDRVREAGWETVGEIVDFENRFLCYVRGPEGLIVELAERLDGAPG